MTASLTDHLRALPDTGLAALIRLRPDLVVPPPTDLAGLAARIQSRLSVTRAVDRLDRFTLQILDALRLTRDADGTASVATVLTMTTPAGVDPGRVRAAVSALSARFLCYGPEQSPLLVPTLEEVCGPYVCGLGRFAAELSESTARLVADPAGLRRVLLSAPPNARAVLDRLAEGPPRGNVSTERLRAGSESPVRWLLDAHLLVTVAPDAVELPREIGLLLRREIGPLGRLEPEPPTIEPTMVDPTAADRAGAGTALEAVQRVTAILEALAAEPAVLLRAGGLGVRDLRRLARVTGTSEPVTALLLEVTAGAGLLGEVTGDNGGGQFLPTAGYDGWLAAPLAARWAQLASAWLALDRAPALASQRDERDRPIPVLSPEAERPAAAEARRAILGVLLELDPGAAPDPDAVLTVLTWHSPRRAGRPAAGGVAAVLAEAAGLGLTGLGALTGYGRLLLAEQATAREADPLGIDAEDDRTAAGSVAALTALLPAPVDHVLLQADLSIIVPGPPQANLAADLTLVAEAESASVHRITSSSLRKALDAGFTATDLHKLFASRSRTPVPQALTYLVDDLARRHGGLRTGTAGSYLRSEDEGLIAEVVVDRRLVDARLRRLAPTVLVTSYPMARLLAALRDAGYAPVAEDATGAAVLSRPTVRRAAAQPSATRSRVTDPLVTPRFTEPQLAGIIEQMRHGEALARAAARAPATLRTPNGATAAQAHTQALAVLQQALREKIPVWVGYVDGHGSLNSRLVRPVSMGGGYLRAEDERTETLHTFALHRITAAVLPPTP